MSQKREITIKDGLAYIPLTREFVAVIDACDVELVSGFNWFAVVGKKTAYAVRRAKKEESPSGKISMHRQIMGDPSGMQVDHIDVDGMNNRRANLRVVRSIENSYNRRKNSKNTSGFKGVCWNKSTKKWQAQIRSNGVRKYLGLHDSPEEAHRVYCEAAKELHGEYARFS